MSARLRHHVALTVYDGLFGPQHSALILGKLNNLFVHQPQIFQRIGVFQICLIFFLSNFAATHIKRLNKLDNTLKIRLFNKLLQPQRLICPLKGTESAIMYIFKECQKYIYKACT